MSFSKAKGTATLAVNLPGSGELALKGKGVKPIARLADRTAGPQSERPVAAAGAVKLKITPKGKTKKKLKRTGKAKVTVTVTYTPSGGDANSQAKTIKLKKRLRNSG